MTRVLFRGHGKPDRYHEMDEPLHSICVVPIAAGGSAYYRLVKGTSFDGPAYVETDAPFVVVLRPTER